MNPKQKRFCDEYLIDCNATQAAIRAGYAPKTAYAAGVRMLKNVELRAYIDEQLEKIHNERTATAQEVVEYLTSVLRGEAKDQTLRVQVDGEQEVIEIAASTKERLRAAELLGKCHGIFTVKVNMGGAVPVVITGADDLED